MIVLLEISICHLIFVINEMIPQRMSFVKYIMTHE